MHFEDRRVYGQYRAHTRGRAGSRRCLRARHRQTLSRIGDRRRFAFDRKDGVAGAGAPIACRKAPDKRLVAVASRSHRSAETDEFLATLDIADFAAAGSSLKFCLIAEGLADVYPRLGRTMEWDTGAGQAVLEAAGGRVIEFGAQTPLRYGKRDRGFDNPHFIAWGG
ncbi:MAG: inositol monophosphatase family protein [Parvularculaceae bacterium]